MDFEKLLESLLPEIGQAGVDALRDKLEEISAGQDEPWKVTTLQLIADGVDEFGPVGVDKATEAVIQLIEGEEVPEIDWADLETASNVLAHLQNIEADKRTEVKVYLTKAGKTLGPILKGIVQGLISST